MHPTKRRFFAVKSSFSCPQPCQTLPLCSPFPCCGQSNHCPLKSPSAGAWVGLRAGGSSASPHCTLMGLHDPSHPCQALHPNPPPSRPLLLLFKLQHQLPLQTSVLPSAPAPFFLLHLAFFVAKFFLSVMPLTFTTAPTLCPSSHLTTLLCDACSLFFPSSWLFFKI